MDRLEEAAQVAALQAQIAGPRRSAPAWVPARSGAVYKKVGARIGAQLEKLVPPRDTRGDLGGLLTVGC